MSHKDIVLSDSESSQSSAFNVVMSASQSSELLKPKYLGRNQENTIHTYFEYTYHLLNWKISKNHKRKTV